jgi:hypothetical protein
MKKRTVLFLLMGLVFAAHAQDVVMSDTAAKAETLSEGSGFMGVVM